MVFADIPENEYKDFEPIRWVKIEPNIPVRLRVLDHKAYHAVKHYLPQQKISILCLGEEVCPICINNQKLVDANPEMKHNQIKGILARQNRYLVNVLNRTLVKRNGLGEVIYPQADGQFPKYDANTGEDVSKIEPEPLDQVEVLERGPTLFSQLNVIHESVRDPKTQEPLGIWNYDIQVSATGSGRKMVTTVVPLAQFNEPVEVDAESMYVLETVPIQLAPDEIHELLKGTSLSDIFAARRAEDEEAVTAEEARLSGLEDDALQTANENVEKLFVQAEE